MLVMQITGPYFLLRDLAICGSTCAPAGANIVHSWEPLIYLNESWEYFLNYSRHTGKKHCWRKWRKTTPSRSWLKKGISPPFDLVSFLRWAVLRTSLEKSFLIVEATTAKGNFSYFRFFIGPGKKEHFDLDYILFHTKKPSSFSALTR